MALTPGSVVQVSGAPSAGEQVMEDFDQLTQTWAEVQVIIDGSYAEIYEEDNLTAQSIVGHATTYTKVTNFQVNGDSKNCTPDQANDKITITQAGEYKITFSTSFTATGTNNNWFAAVFIDGVEQSDMHFERKIGAGGDYGSTSVTGIHSFPSVPLDVDVRMRHDDIGVSRDLTKRYMNLNVARIGSI